MSNSYVPPDTARLQAEGEQQAEGARLFASDEPGTPAERPGVVEGSNVQSVVEITTLTAQMREFQFATQ
ncbi:MAG TPA: flagellar basal body rod C-terminal domain-containing protein, partial [Acidimicrobiales bacterium]|nr:flagellar basal body rod C-terminal domain-containing protein [Acidimicrobiales bacterium]